MKTNPLIELMIKANALKFGDFTTKSGRHSPYFFNTGAISSGKQLGDLADLYCQAVLDRFPNGLKHLYGPAYKGISLSVLLSDRLFQATGCDCQVTYNRKELKVHGEGGQFIGAPLSPGTSVFIVEDILTGGTSLRESIALLAEKGVRVDGAVIGIDRMEQGRHQVSAKEEIEREFGFPIFCLASVLDIVSYLKEKVDLQYFSEGIQGRAEILARVESYLDLYGALRKPASV